MKKTGMLTGHVLTGFVKILISDAIMQDGGSFVDTVSPPHRKLVVRLFPCDGMPRDQS